MTNPYIEIDGNLIRVVFLEQNSNEPFNVFDPLRLLAEWYNWWSTTDIAPNKMPNSLHTRTAMVLSKRETEERV